MTTRLHVERSGAEGTAVVLLHSAGLSGAQWRRLGAELVKRGLRPLAVDLTGHGTSTPWPEPEPFSFRRDVAEVVELLREERRAHIIGHSYGALIGLHAAVAAPDAVESLTLYEPVAFGVLDRAEDEDARATLDRVSLRWGDTPAAHDAWLAQFVDYWGGAGAWTALREPARAEFRRVGWVVCEGVRSLLDDKTRGPTFATVRAPTHLFTAERSPLAAQRVVQRLGEALRGAQTTMLPGIGHMGPLTNPDVVNPLLLAAILRNAPSTLR
jgi:pimeloyl-ACP methyl ester carboxylesterase